MFGPNPCDAPAKVTAAKLRASSNATSAPDASAMNRSGTIVRPCRSTAGSSSHTVLPSTSARWLKTRNSIVVRGRTTITVFVPASKSTYAPSAAKTARIGTRIRCSSTMGATSEPIVRPFTTMRATAPSSARAARTGETNAHRHATWASRRQNPRMQNILHLGQRLLGRTRFERMTSSRPGLPQSQTGPRRVVRADLHRLAHRCLAYRQRHRISPGRHERLLELRVLRVARRRGLRMKIPDDAVESRIVLARQRLNAVLFRVFDRDRDGIAAVRLDVIVDDQTARGVFSVEFVVGRAIRADVIHFV